MIIYKITNLVNNKVYIGQTIHSLESRFRGHILDSRQPCSHSKIHEAIYKYGKENFICEKIDEVENCEDLDFDVAKQILNEKEKYWIKYFDSTNNENGYNILIGGEDNRMYSPEARKNHKLSMQKEETRKKLSDGMKKSLKERGGFSKEHLQKIKESNHKHYEEYFKPLGLSVFGRPCDTRSIPCYCITDKN